MITSLTKVLRSVLCAPWEALVAVASWWLAVRNGAGVEQSIVRCVEPRRCGADRRRRRRSQSDRRQTERRAA